MQASLDKLRSAVASRLEDKSRNGSGLTLGGISSSLGGYRYVLLAVMLVVVYYALYASDRYATVAQVYIKEARATTAPMPSLPGLFGSTSERQDALLIQQYILSKDMLNHLDETLELKAHYSSSEWDIFSRLDDDATDEEFLDYYHDRVLLTLDPESSILTLEGQAYTADYSKRLMEEVVAQSETFINRVIQKIAEEEIAFVEGELKRTKLGLNDAQQDMLAFQNENALLSPEATSIAVQGIVNELEAELVRLRAEEKNLSSYLNEGASELVSVRGRIIAISDQLIEERLKMTSSQGDKTLNDLNARFKEKELTLRFATDLYQSTLIGYEQARIEVFRKMKYLVVIEQPQTADEPLYPRKIYNLATLFVILSLVYGIIVMIIATIREHRDV